MISTTQIPRITLKPLSLSTTFNRKHSYMGDFTHNRMCDKKKRDIIKRFDIISSPLKSHTRKNTSPPPPPLPDPKKFLSCLHLQNLFGQRGMNHFRHPQFEYIHPFNKREFRTDISSRIFLFIQCL